MAGVDIKVNQIQQTPQIEQPVQAQETDGTFKFTIAWHDGGDHQTGR